MATETDILENFVSERLMIIKFVERILGISSSEKNEQLEENSSLEQLMQMGESKIAEKLNLQLQSIGVEKKIDVYAEEVENEKEQQTNKINGVSNTENTEEKETPSTPEKKQTDQKYQTTSNRKARANELHLAALFTYALSKSKDATVQKLAKQFTQHIADFFTELLEGKGSLPQPPIFEALLFLITKASEGRSRFPDFLKQTVIFSAGKLRLTADEELDGDLLLSLSSLFLKGNNAALDEELLNLLTSLIARFLIRKSEVAELVDDYQNVLFRFLTASKNPTKETAQLLFSDAELRRQTIATKYSTIYTDQKNTSQMNLYSPTTAFDNRAKARLKLYKKLSQNFAKLLSLDFFSEKKKAFILQELCSLSDFLTKQEPMKGFPKIGELIIGSKNNDGRSPLWFYIQVASSELAEGRKI